MDNMKSGFDQQLADMKKQMDSMMDGLGGSQVSKMESQLAEVMEQVNSLKAGIGPQLKQELDAMKG